MSSFIKILKKSTGDTCQSCDCPPDVCASCCPPVSIKCDSRAASKGKCGYPENNGYQSAPLKVYLKNSYIDSGSWDAPGLSSATAYYTTDKETDKDTCVESVTSQTCSSSREEPPGHTSCTQSSCSDGGCWDPIIGSAGAVVTTTTTSNTIIVVGTTTVFRSGNETRTTTLSVEYKTEDLISNTKSALPPFPETYTGSCVSARSLTTDETGYSEIQSRVIFYVATALPSTQRLRIAYHFVFTPTSGAPSNAGTGTTTIEPSQTQSAPIDIPVPTENGTMTIVKDTETCEVVS